MKIQRLRAARTQISAAVRRIGSPVQGDAPMQRSAATIGKAREVMGRAEEADPAQLPQPTGAQSELIARICSQFWMKGAHTLSLPFRDPH